jgi:hypothetical protein
LVALADATAPGKGFLAVATLGERPFTEEGKVRSQERSIQDSLHKRNAPALLRVQHAPDFVTGMEGLAGEQTASREGVLPGARGSIVPVCGTC